MSKSLRRGWSALVRFWQTEESLPILLALIVVLAFVMPPLVPDEKRGGLVGDIVFSGLLVAGVATVPRQGKWAVRAVVALSLVAVLVRWAARLEPAGVFEILTAATAAIALALLALVVLSMVLRSGTVTSRRIQGAVAAYLLLGLAWAGAYECVALSQASAFAGSGLTDGQHWVYYSLVTLSTMGYGDITPVHPVARSLAVGEAITGQLYLAILISRLVALELQARSTR